MAVGDLRGPIIPITAVVACSAPSRRPGTLHDMCHLCLHTVRQCPCPILAGVHLWEVTGTPLYWISGGCVAPAVGAGAVKHACDDQCADNW